MTEAADAAPDPAAPDSAPPDAEVWHVYVLASESRPVTYVGIAKDVEARLAQHNGEARGGAKSTRAARPWRVARVTGPYLSRSEAQSAEHALKKLRGPARLEESEPGS
ncbi:MAG: GIY-YIG nuclease family protein [Planctomycetota bacterium]